MVFNLALNYLQNKEDAEEVTQDVFIAVHKSLNKFRGESQINTWIYRITINKCLDFIKAKKRKKRFSFFTQINEYSVSNNLYRNHVFDHPGVLLEEKEALEILFNHINRLPSKQKTALILSKLEQKKQKEIAEIMQTSTKAVESLIQRAKINLKKLIDLNEGK